MSKLRFFLKVNNEHKLLCWFELKGDDLYWGSAKPDSTNIEPIKFDGTNLTLTIPSNVERLNGKSLKGSYHASGQSHFKLGDKYHGSKQQLPLKNDIVEPYLFLALMSMPSKHYKSYKKKLTRENSNAIVLSVTESNESNRLFIEFFLTTAGTFSLPSPLLKFNHSLHPLPKPITQSLNSQLILAARYYVLGGELNNWQPDIEIWYSLLPKNY